MMEYRQLIRMLIGAVVITLIVIGIASLIPTKAKADTTAVKQTVIDVGTAMKGWAMAFGGQVERSSIVQYQKKSFEQAKEQLARNKTQIVDLFATIGDALNKIMVGGNNVGKDQK